MNNSNKSILLPYDFTLLSEYALEYAIQYSKVLHTEITLVHIAQNDKEKIMAEVSLRHFTEDELCKRGVVAKFRVLKGKFITEMEKLLQTDDFNLVIIKTDGPSGMEKYMGSTAMKIIAGSQIPFIVIQDKPERREVKRVVFPIDFRKENKQKLNWILFLSRYYALELNLFVPNYKDVGLQKKISNNLQFAQQVLDKRKIVYKITIALLEEDYVEQTIEFSTSIAADLILIIFNKDLGFKDYLLGPMEQEFIVNKPKIPIMCVNPRTDLRKLGGFH